MLRRESAKVLNLKQHITRKRHGKSRYAVIGVGMALVLATSQSVMAQDNAQNNEKVQQASDGLNLNLGNTINPEFASSFTGQGNIIDLPSTSVGSTLFKLDISDPNCLAGVGQCLRRDDRVNLGLSTQFTSVSEKGLDVSLKPRASMKFDDENSSALVGAVVGQFHLQDRIIVGDAQAGVGYRIGDADVSLSYMRREAQAEDFSFTEDAAALSFTWKR